MFCSLHHYSPNFRCIQNFSEICKLSIILELDINTFCQMLSSDDLFVHSEYEVFQIAVRWIAHDIEERLKYTVRIINLIRFHYMTVDELYTCAETTSFMRDYDRFREAILKANWYSHSIISPLHMTFAVEYDVKHESATDQLSYFRL